MLLFVSFAAAAPAPADPQAYEDVRAYTMVEADLAACALLRSRSPEVRALADRVVDDDYTFLRDLHERTREADVPQADTASAATIRANGEAVLAALRAQPADQFDRAFLTTLAAVADGAAEVFDLRREDALSGNTQTFLLNVGTGFDLHRDAALDLLEPEHDRAGGFAMR